jgi:hypothetical protein
VPKIKKAKAKEVTAVMEVLFKLLDKADISPSTILKSDAHKEHYESLLMFAFRKLQAARYHRDRVLALLKENEDETESVLGEAKLSSKLQVTSMRASVSKTANEFTYELSAFFAAIRSSIDFLARLCAEHTKAIQVDSISTFLKFVEEGRTGPTVDVMAAHVDWLKHLRDYRDYLVHRLVIGAVSGGQRQWKGGKWTSTTYPVIVPANTPQHVPDTRRVRAMDNHLSNFDIYSSESWATYSDGTKSVIDHTVEMTPREGYMRIEKLMARELTDYEKFFVDVAERLVKLKFGPATVSTKQK